MPAGLPFALSKKHIFSPDKIPKKNSTHKETAIAHST
jgi:hypothetical protein